MNTTNTNLHQEAIKTISCLTPPESDTTMLHFKTFAARKETAVSPADVDVIDENTPPENDGVTKQPEEGPAVFLRREIRTGKLVGEGSFSEVYEVVSFKLDKDGGEDNKNSPWKRQRRKALQQSQHHNTLGERCSFRRTNKSRYVVKQIHSKLLTKDPKIFHRAIRDLQTEIDLLSKIDHPHVVKIRGRAAEEEEVTVGNNALEGCDSFFLVLDRLEETLAERIAKWNRDKVKRGPSYYLEGPSNEKLTRMKANYALQIARALQHLHNRRILYRDLKPQNIGFKEIYPRENEKDVIALFDFGLARQLPERSSSSSTTTTTSSSSLGADNEVMWRMSVVGTRRYMAPEIVLTGKYNAKVDTYSFGMVYFEMITQMRPFDGIHRDEHREIICKLGKRPKLYPYYHLPKALEDLLRLSWAQDVSKRLTMDQVCQRLECFLAGRTTPIEDNNPVGDIIIETTSSSVSDLTISSNESFQGNAASKNRKLEGSMNEAKRSHSNADPQSLSNSGGSGNGSGAATVPEVVTISSASSSSLTSNDDNEVWVSPNETRSLGNGKHPSICERTFRFLFSNIVKKHHNLFNHTHC
jgi:serine/threonine protein kinase